MQVNLGQINLPDEPLKHGFISFSNLIKQANLVSAAIGYLRIRSQYCDTTVCDKVFKSLPNHRSFDEILDDTCVWVSFGSKREDLANGKEWIGLTIRGDRRYDIGINAMAFAFFERKDGKFTPEAVRRLAAILVHEMAHVNGAPNDTNTAESMMLFCGFEKYFDSTVIG